MSRVIRVAIVEDHSGFREALGELFASFPDFRVVASCPNAETALRRIPQLGCDLVLLDINLPGKSGIECLRVLRPQMPGTKMVMLTAYDDNDNLFQSLLAGADGYLLKRTQRNRLIEQLRDIAAGGAPISPQIARRMVEYFHKINTQGTEAPLPAPDPGVTTDLTAREKEILGHLADGCTPKEVAASLNISWQTVRNHIRVIYEKLHVHTRTDAVLKYLGRSPASERRSE